MSAVDTLLYMTLTTPLLDKNDIINVMYEIVT